MAEASGKGLINGPVYEAARFSTQYLNVPPNMHRLRNALGLAAGLLIGRQIMNILAGETPDGKKIEKDSLLLPLRPLHGLLAYDHFSDDPKQRWMKVFDLMVPGVLGGVGAALGSVSFFRAQKEGLLASKLHLPPEKFTIAAAEHTALATHAKPWSIMSAMSAVFGSASGFGLFPSPANYSSTLGATFTIRAERAMANPLMRGFFNSHSPYPFRPPRLMGRMIAYLSGNHSLHPEQIEAYATGILKPIFRYVKPEQIKSFTNLVLEERNRFLQSGKPIAEVEADVKKALETMLSAHGFEKTLLRAGIDPRDAVVGDMGIISKLSHIIGDALGMGVSRTVEETHKHLHDGLALRHPELAGKPYVPKTSTNPHSTAATVASGAFLGTGLGILGAIATSKDTNTADLNPAPRGAAVEPGPIKPKTAQRHIVHSKRRHGFVNGSLLDTAEGIGGMLSAGIGLHRVSCAAGLTAGSWLGDKVMEALTGVSFAGQHVSKEKIWEPLQKFYKALAYNPHSDAMNDRWMQVLRWGVPGVLGAVAVAEGSKLFFAKRREETRKNSTLDEAEEKTTFAQSQPWGYTAAITSLFGFPSGLPMLPFTNYSTNLGTRFSMASGRKIALPVVGKYWSNNATLFPFGPPGMLNLLIKEAINNKSHDPELLETYAIGVLKPWFEKVTPAQVEAFVMKIHEVRDRFFKEGGVPEEMKKDLEEELKAHFKGTGLEETLESIGLNPLKATLGNNGWSGSIANALGARKNVDVIKAEYAASYRERHQRREQAPPVLSPGV